MSSESVEDDVDGGNAYFNGKIADVRAIQGTAVIPTDFTVPTSALTTDAGSQVVFAELSTTDVKTSYPPVITNDGLTVSASTPVDQWTHGRATMSFTSGKYYWEAIPNGNGMIGLELDTADGDRATFNNGIHVLAARDGKIWKDDMQVVSGQTDWTDGDVVGIAVDGDTGLVQFYINGVAGMSHNTGWGSDKVKIPAYGVYKYGSHDWSWTFNFGAGGFAYSAPEGYQALGAASPITASLLISGNGGVSDASPSSHSLTLNGDVTTATGFPYAVALGKSITFDGNGDYISVPSSDDVIMGSEDFTFETWFYHENASTVPWGRMVEAGAYTSTETWRVNQVGSTGQIAFQIGGPSPRQEIFSNAVLALQEWNHIFIVRNNNTITMFINGVAQSSTISYTGSFTAGMTLIGQGDTNY